MLSETTKAEANNFGIWASTVRPETNLNKLCFYGQNFSYCVGGGVGLFHRLIKWKCWIYFIQTERGRDTGGPLPSFYIWICLGFLHSFLGRSHWASNTLKFKLIKMLFSKIAKATTNKFYVEHWRIFFFQSSINYASTVKAGKFVRSFTIGVFFSIHLLNFEMFFFH